MKPALFTPVLALAALATSQTAQAQQSCVAPEDVTDMVTYVVPLAFDAAMQTCDAQYKPDGFMKSGGGKFADRFRAKQDAAWPGAYKLGKQLIAKRTEEKGQDSAGMIELIEQMPEQQVRPFIDGFLQQMIAAEIKPDTCTDIERGLTLLSPLPVENTSALVTFIFEVSGVKDPKICRG